MNFIYFALWITQNKVSLKDAIDHIHGTKDLAESPVAEEKYIKIIFLQVNRKIKSKLL